MFEKQTAYGAHYLDYPALTESLLANIKLQYFKKLISSNVTQ